MQPFSSIICTSLLLLAGCSPQPTINAQDLETEIKLARTEGFSVTVEDLRKKIPSVSKEDNAADLVLQMHELKGDYNSVESARNALNENDENSMVLIESALQMNEALIPLIHEIAKKKSLDFDRKWELGVALSLPELRTLKLGGQILTLMAWKAANEEDHATSIAHLNEAIAFSNLINEPLTSPGATHFAMNILIFRATAMLAKKYPSQSQYVALLKEMVSKANFRSITDLIKNELALVIVTFEAFKSKESAELYSKKVDSPFNLKLAPSEPEYSKRKAELIKFFRNLVQVYDRPISEIQTALFEMDEQLLQVLQSNPNAQSLVNALGPYPSMWEPLPNSEQVKIVFNQVIKNIESKSIRANETKLQLNDGTKAVIKTEVDGTSFRVSLLEESSMDTLFQVAIK